LDIPLIQGRKERILHGGRQPGAPYAFDKTVDGVDEMRGLNQAA
jgi:hypothetical protein